MPEDGPVRSERASWSKYFMDIAYLVAERSTCLRRKVGAVAVLDRRILATGYNGAPSGVRHCLEAGCLRASLGIPSGQRHEICRGVHAEQNVIIQSALHGISLKGAELYCTTFPCFICSKMLINCGIKKIWVEESYPDGLSESMLREAGVEIVFYDRLTDAVCTEKGRQETQKASYGDR